MNIKIFADGADLAAMRKMAEREDIAGFTTNPTLLKKSGVTDYKAFALEALAIASGRPVSFEVIADDCDEMMRQARLIASWGPNAYVKIPVVNSTGRPTYDLIKALAEVDTKVNVTAIFTVEQAQAAAGALAHASFDVQGVVSIFAGRIADAGINPVDQVVDCIGAIAHCAEPLVPEVLWASPRQVYDVMLAEEAGCDIITMTPDLIAKLASFGKDLSEFSRETSEMFYRDAQAAGYQL